MGKANRIGLTALWCGTCDQRLGAVSPLHVARADSAGRDAHARLARGAVATVLLCFSMLANRCKKAVRGRCWRPPRRWRAARAPLACSFAPSDNIPPPPPPRGGDGGGPSTAADVLQKSRTELGLVENSAESYVLIVGRALNNRGTIKTVWACYRVASGAAPTAAPSSGRSRDAIGMHSD